MSSRLRLETLFVGFPGGNVLFENLNLTVAAGKLVCFMGRNGIGKSTLIKTIAGLQTPLSGSIYIDDQPVVPRESAKQVAIVLTDRISTPGLTVEELVLFGRYPYLNWRLRLTNADLAKVNDSLEKLGLTHLKKKELNRLSDGQRQMVAVARALAQDTPVIILDEPTAHLDLNNRLEVMQMLKDLARETGKTFLIATHELDLALQLSDEIWLANDQKKLITGIPEHLVLAGIFDEVFHRKGFDLKTGRVDHHITRSKRLILSGEGYRYLWTRNALERSGFEVVSGPADGTHIEVRDSDWLVDGAHLCSNLIQVLNFIS